MSDVLKIGDVTDEESKAWNAYWATRDEWVHASDVFPEMRAFVMGRRSVSGGVEVKGIIFIPEEVGDVFPLEQFNEVLMEAGYVVFRGPKEVLDQIRVEA